MAEVMVKYRYSNGSAIKIKEEIIMKKALLFLSFNLSLCLLCSCGDSEDASSVNANNAEPSTNGSIDSHIESQDTAESNEQSDTENDAYKVTCYKTSSSTIGDAGGNDSVWTIDDKQFCIDFVTWAESIPENFEEKDKPEPNGQTAVGGYTLEVQYHDENGELHDLGQTKDPSANIKLDGKYYHISSGDMDLYNALYDYQE